MRIGVERCCTPSLGPDVSCFVIPGGDDSDFGQEDSLKVSNRKPPSRQIVNQRSLSPDYAHLAPKKRPKKKKEEFSEPKESLDELLGNESLGFAQAKLAHMQYNLDLAVRSGGTTMQLGSSEDESSEMEFKPRPVSGQRKQAKTTQLRDIKAPRRKKESIDRGLELREGVSGIRSDASPESLF